MKRTAVPMRMTWGRHRRSSAPIFINLMTLPFSRLSVWSFLFFACLARKLPSCVVYVDITFAAVSSFTCPARTSDASSFLMLCNSMNLPFSTLSCSVLLFLCMPCPQIAILSCLRRYNIHCGEFLYLSGKNLRCFIVLNAL